MGGQLNRRIRPQFSPGEREELEQWARELVKAIGKREARTILEDYKALAGSSKVTKYGREEATKRAEILAKLL